MAMGNLPMSSSAVLLRLVAMARLLRAVLLPDYVLKTALTYFGQIWLRNFCAGARDVIGVTGNADVTTDDILPLILMSTRVTTDTRCFFGDDDVFCLVTFALPVV